MLSQVNAYRASHGLPALRYSKALELAANEHAYDMYRRGFFSHTNPDGDGPARRAAKAGFCHRYVGENIAYGKNARARPEEALQMWKDSPGHDKNLRKPDYAWVGMGHFRGEVDGGTVNYWVQVFALR